MSAARFLCSCWCPSCQPLLSLCSGTLPQSKSVLWGSLSPTYSVYPAFPSVWRDCQDAISVGSEVVKETTRNSAVTSPDVWAWSPYPEWQALEPGVTADHTGLQMLRLKWAAGIHFSDSLYTICSWHTTFYVADEQIDVCVYGYHAFGHWASINVLIQKVWVCLLWMCVCECVRECEYVCLWVCECVRMPEYMFSVCLQESEEVRIGGACDCESPCGC